MQSNEQGITLKTMWVILALVASWSGLSGAATHHGDGQWPATGREPGGTFYSPLTQINRANVARLGFAWEFRTGTYRGMEGTPLYLDGTLYVPGIWGMVYALDAANGSRRWMFDPHNDGQFARNVGSDVVNRGIALANGTLYTTSTDCRLFALDARTGRVIWSVSTLAPPVEGYGCNGALQLTRHAIVLGNSGGDNGKGGVRGYVSAFDQKTGALLWRFYTVPRRDESAASTAMRDAEKTWDPQRPADFGGGGNVWGLMAYDPDLDLLYCGTGNAAPYHARRDWDGADRRSDRLYAASILALKASSGALAWYYQTTPGDVWDFDATANVVLTQLPIAGVQRRVLLQANKNGYFYVLDRVTGRPLSAVPFAYMNWSTGMDAAFRPIVSRDVNYDAQARVVYPSALGAHSWPPMSFSPATRLAYIPAIETGNIMADVTTNPGSRLSHIETNTGETVIWPDKFLDYEFWESLVGALPRFPATPPGGGGSPVRSVLRALDPSTGKVAWEQQTSQDYVLLDGGVLATAGRVVFAGREDGRFVAYDDTSGELLKVLDTGSAIMAAPMTYQLNGRQYVTVLTGHGGTVLNYAGTAAMARSNEGRVLTFTLDRDAHVPQPAARDVGAPRIAPPQRRGSPELVQAGRGLFVAYCARCHSFGIPAITPDLTRSALLGSGAAFNSVVLDGALTAAGMAKFDDLLSEGDVSAIHSYLVDEAWKAYGAEQADAKRP